MGGAFHRPVMLRQAVDSLMVKPGGFYVDGTVGGGGHAGEILRRSSPDGVLIGIDRDEDALEEARRALQPFGRRAVVMHGNFSDMSERVRELVPKGADGILLDLGVSSRQLEDSSRGFSFAVDGPLDMRMDRQDSVSAFDVVNTFSEERLRQVIREFGEERRATAIARRIIAARQRAPIRTTGQLSGLIAGTRGFRPGKLPIHPATRTFQAIRMVVNDELGHLRRGVIGGIDILKPGGRFSVISFHSLEDRLVKALFRDAAGPCRCPPRLPLCVCGKRGVGIVITKRAVRPDPAESEENPRARSARLRTLEKV